MQDKYTFLLVDDEESILNALCRVFKEENCYEIITAKSGKEALEKISQEKIDLVISDQRMPVMQGVELLKRIKDIYPDTIRILLSGYSDFDALIGAINEGEVYRFVAKPWDNEKLKELIRNALEQRDVIKIVTEIVANITQAIKEIGALQVDTYQDEKNIYVQLKGESKIIPEEMLFQLINLFMSAALKKTGAEKVALDLKSTSGIIARRKGKVTFTLDLGRGMSLVIELPVERENKAE